MIGYLRAILVIAMIALAVPVAIAAVLASGAAGPQYRVVDLLPFVSPLIAALLVLSGVLAAVLKALVRLPRGAADGLSGALISGSVMLYGAGAHVFADLGLGAPLLAMFGTIVAILCGGLAFFRWQLSGRPGA